MYLVFFSRHGDRTAWTGAPCWPNDSATWSCDLTASSIPTLQLPAYGKAAPRLYQKSLCVCVCVSDGVALSWYS